jgi:rhodanese-related sulfurtransferase
MMKSISVQSYDSARKSADAPILIDVREPWEFAITSIESAVLNPLGEIRTWAQTLDKSKAYVIMCHHGGRSAMACQILSGMGFADVSNLDGGIDMWSLAVDPKTPRY